MWNRSNPDPKPIAWFQVATVIAVYANFEFAKIQGIGWGWAGVIWLYSFVNFVPLDLFKFAIRYMLSSKAWNIAQNKVEELFSVSVAYIQSVLRFIIFKSRVLLIYSLMRWLLCAFCFSQTAFTMKKNYGREEREVQWATAQRSLHGLPVPESGGRGSSYAAELSEIVEQARLRYSEHCIALA